jgi:hypothetical protein
MPSSFFSAVLLDCRIPLTSHRPSSIPVILLHAILDMASFDIELFFIAAHLGSAESPQARECR